MLPRPLLATMGAERGADAALGLVLQEMWEGVVTGNELIRMLLRTFDDEELQRKVIFLGVDKQHRQVTGVDTWVELTAGKDDLIVLMEGK